MSEDKYYLPKTDAFLKAFRENPIDLSPEKGLSDEIEALRKRCDDYEGALRKIAVPALGGKLQQQTAQIVLAKHSWRKE